MTSSFKLSTENVSIFLEVRNLLLEINSSPGELTSLRYLIGAAATSTF